MKRQSCVTCLRPSATCICKLVRRVSNEVSLIILQHPQELQEAKNSARLLHMCLENSQIQVGETFGESFFAQLRSDSRYYDLLLYPETPEEKSLGIKHAPIIDSERLNIGDNSANFGHIRLWVIDATWRKSRKMLYLNPELQSMPRVGLINCPHSIYKIRKAHSENQLSTLEASCYALRQLEQNTVDYEPVLNAFTAFVAEQGSFLPSFLLPSS